jgi:hypothetical protein
MVTIRVRLENGHFIPIEPLPPLEEGSEYELALSKKRPSDEEYTQMLDQTRGMWADIDEDIEGFMEESRKKLDEAWRKKLNSL